MPTTTSPPENAAKRGFKSVDHLMEEAAQTKDAAATLYMHWTEADLMAFVRRTARTMGWGCYHTAFSMKSDPGFPDLVLVKPPRIIFAELKREGLLPTVSRQGRNRRWLKGQIDWLDELTGVPAAEVYLWYPSDQYDIGLLLWEPEIAKKPLDCIQRLSRLLAQHRAGEKLTL